MRLTALLLVLPCATALAQQPPLRSATMVTDFGGAIDDPAAELLGVTDVVRTADGGFVVANGKPLEVRRYDAGGRLLTRLGRQGSGPGEFRFSAALQPWPGDSVLTWSGGTRRWMLFALDGRLVREWPLAEGTTPPHTAELFGSAFVRTGVGASAACAAATIRRLAPPTDSVLHQAMVDPAGRIWLRPAGAETWTIHTPEGRPMVRLAMPGRFTATQLDGNEVVGTRLDDDDFSHVTVLQTRLDQPSTATRCTAPPQAVIPNINLLKTTMRNLMTAQEAYYADHATYAGSLAQLKGIFGAPEGVGVRIMAGRSGGHAVMAWNLDGPGRCVVSVGEAIPDWPDGSLGCGT